MTQSVVSRAYNRFTINPFRGTIVKESETERLTDEIEYYVNLPDECKIWFPRLVSSDTMVGQLELEYYPGSNLGSHMLRSPPLASVEWCGIFSSLLDVLDEWSTLWPDGFGSAKRMHNAGYKMYIMKTAREYRAFVDQKIWPELYEPENLTYNGKQYINFEPLWKMYTKGYIQNELLNHITFTFIHGDFCFANILYVGEHLRFVDPRGSFGTKGVLGDPRYDVAKLSHSVYGHYEMLNTNSFNLIHERDQWTVEEKHPIESLGMLFDKTFFSVSSRFSRKEIRTIEGLIFVGACARHYENPQRQAALYLRGIQALNEAMHMGD